MCIRDSITAGGHTFQDISVDEIIMSYEPIQNKETISSEYINYPLEDIAYSQRNKAIGSDWIYLKIYAKKLTLKKIVKNEIKKYGEQFIPVSYTHLTNAKIFFCLEITIYIILIYIFSYLIIMKCNDFRF